MLVGSYAPDIAILDTLRTFLIFSNKSSFQINSASATFQPMLLATCHIKACQIRGLNCNTFFIITNFRIVVLLLAFMESDFAKKLYYKEKGLETSWSCDGE